MIGLNNTWNKQRPQMGLMGGQIGGGQGGPIQGMYQTPAPQQGIYQTPVAQPQPQQGMYRTPAPMGGMQMGGGMGNGNMMREWLRNKLAQRQSPIGLMRM